MFTKLLTTTFVAALALLTMQTVAKIFHLTFQQAAFCVILWLIASAHVRISHTGENNDRQRLCTKKEGSTISAIRGFLRRIDHDKR
jgi:hypothetical protein